MEIPMRRLLLATSAALILAGGAAHATTISDPAGDFLPSFLGAQDPDLDVLSFGVDYNTITSQFLLTATLGGAIDPSKAGLYVIGVNTGTGPNHPFVGIGEPNVVFNQVILLQKTGAAAIGANPLTATINGDSFSLVVPLSLLPSTGFAPDRYGFNLWPRNGVGSNNQISDFAPQNATLAAVPEPAAWTMMVAGFGLLGGALRTRRRPSATFA
jgi:hypothetical protein